MPGQRGDKRLDLVHQLLHPHPQHVPLPQVSYKPNFSLHNHDIYFFQITAVAGADSADHQQAGRHLGLVRGPGLDWSADLRPWSQRITPGLGQCEGRGQGRGGGAGAGGQSSGHHTSGVHRYCPELRTFIDKHPAWVSLGAWTVDYKYYIL